MHAFYLTHSFSTRHRALALAACLCLAQTAPAWAQPKAAPAAPATPAAAQEPRRGQPVTLNFSNADIESVARTIAIITGRSVVLDARVKGTVTLQSERPVRPQQAVNQFAAALRLQNYALIDADGMYKILPEADAKLQARMAGRHATGNQVVTRVFKLRHETASNLLPSLRPLISPNNTISATGSHTLVVTDYADNITRIERLIASVDQPAGNDMEIIPLRHGVASDMAALVQKLLASSAAAASAPGQGAGAGATLVLPESRSNALIVRAPTPALVKAARNLILRLDQPALSGGNGDAGNIWVVHLRNADAVKVAATLRAAMAANAASDRAGVSVNVGGSQQGGTPQVQVTATSALQGSGSPSTGGAIQADPATNSLVITASEPEYRQLRAVIDRLDIRRAQVYVESLIAEVNDKNLANLGVQWQAPFNSNGTRQGLLGTNFGTAGNIFAIGAALASNGATTFQPGAGLNLATTATFQGIPILGMLANFLQSTGSANILSTPNLITLDNEEARIMIGQNVPFVTGQYTNSNTSNGAVNPFQTIERKDVGLTLRVKPQISENGAVKMQIYQEVSNIDPSSVTSSTGLITNKRSIESNVVVGNGQVLVLGGLLSDQYSNSQDKIPLLGDIPVLGQLFRNESRNRQKSNLMVFLRPIVVRDDDATQSLSLNRYDMMRTSQLNTYPAPAIVKPDHAPVLPALAHPVDLWSPVSQPAQPVPTPLIHDNMAPAPHRVFTPDGAMQHGAQDAPPIPQSSHTA